MVNIWLLLLLCWILYVFELDGFQGGPKFQHENRFPGQWLEIIMSKSLLSLCKLRNTHISLPLFITGISVVKKKKEKKRKNITWSKKPHYFLFIWFFSLYSKVNFEGENVSFERALQNRTGLDKPRSYSSLSLSGHQTYHWDMVPTVQWIHCSWCPFLPFFYWIEQRETEG